MVFERVKKIFGINESNSMLGGFDKLRTLKLKNIKYYEDIDSLWTDGNSLSKEIVDTIHSDSKFRLKKALATHKTCRLESHGGKNDSYPKAFTDVIVGVPQSYWDDSMMDGPERLSGMANHLAALHKRDFGDLLLNDRSPSYVIVPSPMVADGEIMFQFGSGVFVPSPDDVLIAELSFSLDGETLTPPPFVFFDEVTRTANKRPVGLYENQQGLMIGGNPEHAPIQLESSNGKNWFSHQSGYIFITPKSWDQPAYGDKEFVEFDRTEELESGEQAVFFKDLQFRPATAADSSSELKYTMTKLEKATVEEKTIKPRSQEDHNLEEEIAPSVEADLLPQSKDEEDESLGTVVLTGEDVSISTPHMLLEGYGLFDVDKVPELETWVLWLDENGRPFDECPTDTANPWCFTVSARAGDKRIFIRRPGATGDFETVEPGALPWNYDNDDDNVSFDIESSPLPLYLGLLQISNPSTSYDITDSPRTFGRGENMDVDHTLDFLKIKNSTKWASGSRNTNKSYGNLNAARKHMSVRYVDGLFEIALQGSSAITHFLKQDGEILTAASKSEETFLLESGDRMFVGSALYRFEAGLRSETDNSNFENENLTVYVSS